MNDRKKIDTSILETAIVHLPAGYAYDLVNAFLNAFLVEAESENVEEEHHPTELDAGDLFRTLMLDEGFQVEEAREIWAVACDIVLAYD